MAPGHFRRGCGVSDQEGAEGPELNAAAIVAALNRHQVRYVIIGAHETAVLPAVDVQLPQRSSGRQLPGKPDPYWPGLPTPHCDFEQCAPNVALLVIHSHRGGRIGACRATAGRADPSGDRPIP